MEMQKLATNTLFWLLHNSASLGLITFAFPDWSHKISRSGFPTIVLYIFQNSLLVLSQIYQQNIDALLIIEAESIEST
jgi:hypothetical protein